MSPVPETPGPEPERHHPGILRRLDELDGQMALARQMGIVMHNAAARAGRERQALLGGFREMLADVAGRCLHLCFEHMDAGMAEILDHHPHAEHLRRAAMQTLETLEAYARARQESGLHAINGLPAFVLSRACASPTSSELIRLGEPVSGERYRLARTYPVLPATSQAGHAYFADYIKLTPGRYAPRLQYLDDTCRTGLIYIGYLGPHLPAGPKEPR